MKRMMKDHESITKDYESLMKDQCKKNFALHFRPCIPSLEYSSENLPHLPSLVTSRYGISFYMHTHLILTQNI